MFAMLVVPINLAIGIPAFGYGQSYYTLRSIFFDRVPPPRVHMHIRKFNVANEVPIGGISRSNPKALPNGSAAVRAAEVEIPEEEKVKFDLWLRDLWRQKDKQITRFLDTGSLIEDSEASVEIPLELRHHREILDAFAFFIPAVAGWVYSRLK